MLLAPFLNLHAARRFHSSCVSVLCLSPILHSLTGVPPACASPGQNVRERPARLQTHIDERLMPIISELNVFLSPCIHCPFLQLQWRAPAVRNAQKAARYVPRSRFWRMPDPLRAITPQHINTSPNLECTSTISTSVLADHAPHVGHRPTVYPRHRRECEATARPLSCRCMRARPDVDLCLTHTRHAHHFSSKTKAMS